MTDVPQGCGAGYGLEVRFFTSFRMTKVRLPPCLRALAVLSVGVGGPVCRRWQPCHSEEAEKPTKNLPAKAEACRVQTGIFQKYVFRPVRERAATGTDANDCCR